MSLVIASMPAGAGFDRLDWQVSSTEIGADCPFSSLPGLERLFMVIKGAGVELTGSGDGAAFCERIEQRREAFRFRGDWRTSCRLLDGPVRVLNVITRHGRVTARLEIGGEAATRESAEQTLVAVDLDSLDAWLLAGEARGAGWPGAGTRRVAVVRLQPAV